MISWPAGFPDSCALFARRYLNEVKSSVKNPICYLELIWDVHVAIKVIPTLTSFLDSGAAPVFLRILIAGDRPAIRKPRSPNTASGPKSFEILTSYFRRNSIETDCYRSFLLLNSVIILCLAGPGRSPAMRIRKNTGAANCGIGI